MSKVTPTQKFGYIEIKQSSRVRPRKLKSWKQRWAVLTKMSNLSSEEYVAKLDLYESEIKWKMNSADKMTFVLENVSEIRPAKSRTHPYAFEVVEVQPVLVISGGTELDSYSWSLSLQQIFTPEKIEAKKDCYQVTISANEHSEKWNLTGHYNMTVSSLGISLESYEGACVISWGLNTLMKFNVKENPVKGQMATLVIECGPNAPTGQGCFLFLSREAHDILGAIRQSICLALALKQSTRNVDSTRTRSVSATVSEKGFKKLLDNYSAPQFVTKIRSDSCSSNSAVSVESPTNDSKLSISPTSKVTSSFCADVISSVETKANIQDGDFKLTRTQETMSHEKDQEFSRKRSSSHPDPNVKVSNGYSEIRNFEEGRNTVPRRITLGCEPKDFDIERLRSVSDMIVSLQTSNDDVYPELVSFQNNDNKSDIDSAISSVGLSAGNDELSTSDNVHIPGSDCIDEHCPCFSRRRSSSTPDLQAYWKMHAAMTRYENDYEELDDLRTSVQINKRTDFDTPPELPARPLSFTFRRNADLGMNSASIRSILQWHGNPNYADARDRHVFLCTCKNIKGARSRSASSGNQCTACGGKITADNNKSSAAKIANNKLTKSMFSDIDNINDIILQVQNVKRRRSSDITPVASSFLLSSLKDDTKRDQISSVKSQGEIPEIFQSELTSQEYLIDLHGEDNCKLATTAARDIPKSANKNSSDALIHFFLDNESLDSTPILAEKWPLRPSSHHGSLTKISSSFPNVPASNVLGSDLPHTWTWHGQNIGKNIDSLDAWGVDTTKNGNSSHTTDVTNPSFFSNPFFS